MASGIFCSNKPVYDQSAQDHNHTGKHQFRKQIRVFLEPYQQFNLVYHQKTKLFTVCLPQRRKINISNGKVNKKKYFFSFIPIPINNQKMLPN